MRQVGRELWAWIADGAHIYVCGDAQRMAKDVERALVDIVAAHGARSDQRGGRLRRRAEEGRPLSDGRVLRSIATHDRHVGQSRAPSEAPPPRMEPLARLPVFFALDGRRAVVAGGTPAAAWKAELLSAAGAEVEVFAAEPCEELLALAAEPPRGAIVIHRRAWDAGDFAGAAIAIGACDDDDEAARFAAAARAAGVPVNVIDKPKFCDFSFGAIVNRSPLVIGISTDGAAPVFGQAIRAKLEALIPRGFARWAEAARRWRATVQASGLSFNGRRRFWQLFTALAVEHPDREPGQPTTTGCSPRPQPRRPPPSRARSRWSAPAPAIRNC